MVDMRDTIIPKSDQLNSDDLMAGPRTVLITKVARCAESEQPIAVHFDGDGGKPYKPCKSMRRVMVAVWGPDASTYEGRSMTLYRDAEVTWGGLAVGGIRVSHMSHIDEPVVLALTATKKARRPFRVLPLVVDVPAAPAPDKAALGAADLVARFDAAEDSPALHALIDAPAIQKQRDWLKQHRPELWTDVEAAVRGAVARTEPRAVAEGVE
jgi:hypothetical protein